MFCIQSPGQPDFCGHKGVRCQSWWVIARSRILTVFVVSLIAAGCSGGSKSAGSRATAPSLPATTSMTTLAGTAVPAPSATNAKPCATAHLTLNRVTAGAAAGNMMLLYEFTNTGPSPCTLTGYPGVSVLDRQGRVVQRPAFREPGPGTSPPLPVATVALPSGGRAYFLVGGADVVPIPGCPTYYHGVTFRVYPPGNTAPIEEPFDESPFEGFCDLSVGPVALHVLGY